MIIKYCLLVIQVDIVFGGTFYALLDSTQLGIHISEEPICQLTQLGEEIKVSTYKLVGQCMCRLGRSVYV